MQALSKYSKNTVCFIIEERAIQMPSQVAIRYGQEQITYRQLHQSMCGVACLLEESGFVAGTPVAVCMPRSIETIAVVLGVLYAGFVIVPLNPEEPTARQLYKLNDTNSVAVFCDNSHGGYVSESKASVIKIDSISDLMEAENSHLRPAQGFSPSDIAYILYTSGSTGHPKGVVNSHLNLLSHVHSVIQVCGFDEHDVVMGCAPIYFDGFIEEIIAPLCAGSQIALVHPDEQLDAKRFFAAIKQCGVTVMSAPPSILNLLNTHVEYISDYGYMRLIFTGGDTLHKNDIDHLVQHATVINRYGLTETTVSSTWYTIPEQVPDNIPIGSPIPGKKVYILDESGEKVPDGVVGEIYLAGEGVALGYLHDDEKTNQCFLPDPYCKTPGSMMFKTGDLGLFDSDGNVRFHGRIDHQVSINGMRVELVEVETALRLHPGIEECVAYKAERNGIDVLISYLVASGLDWNDVYAHMRAYLPSYMIPSELYIIHDVPYDAVGKIDRKRVLELPSVRLLPDQTKRCVRTSQEEIEVAQIWGDLLSLDPQTIPSETTFLELGGTSLQMIALVSRLCQKYGDHIPAESLLAESCIATQSAVIAKYRALSAPILSPAAIDMVERQPLSAAQKRIWILMQWERYKTLYNNVTLDQIKGVLNVNAFVKAYNATLGRHPIMHVRILSDQAEPYQVVSSMPPENGLQVVDLRQFEDDVREQTIQTYISKEINHIFAFDKEDAYCAYLFLLDDNSYLLLQNVHHIITDNWSWKVFAREVGQLYEFYANGGAFPTFDEAPDYFQYVTWENERYNHRAFALARTYWMDKLAGELPILDYSAVCTRPSVLPSMGAVTYAQIGETVHNSLKSLAQREGVSLFSVLLAAFKLVLHGFTGQADLIVGTPVANRLMPGCENTIGLFLNVLPLRDKWDPALTIATWIHTVNTTVREAVAMQTYPFELLLKDLAIEPDMSHSPIFQVLFDYHGDDQDSLILHGARVFPMPVYTSQAKYELTVTLAEHAGMLKMQFEYLPDLMPQEIATSITESYTSLLNNIAANLDQRLQSIAVIPDRERRFIMDDYNHTRTEFPLDQLLHERFQEQAAQTPFQLAYRYMNDELIYEDLNCAANKVARLLNMRGIGRGSIVALCMERSLKLPVILLGILKAGGAYLPLEPNHPRDRLYAMIDSAGVDLLLADDCFISALSEHANEALSIEEVFALSQDMDSGNLPIVNEPDDVFNIVFTSASTGLPKGVRLSNRSVMNRIYWAWHDYPFEPDAVLAHHKSYTLVGSFVEIFGGLLCGVPTVILPSEHIRDPFLLWDDIVSNRITHFAASPPVHSGLLYAAENHAGADCPLRMIITSAEPMPITMLKRLQYTLPNVKILNLYGSTEDTSDVSVYDTDMLPQDAVSVPAGRPIANTRLYVLDEYRNIVPLGVMGEIYAAGEAVSLGYLYNDEYSSGKFMIDTIARNGERMYATGDLGTILHDGNLYLLGRRDHQVKIRGYKVELGEIEQTLEQYPGVTRAAVRVFHNGDRKQMVAYVCFAPGGRTGPRELKAMLASKLPAYMIPDRIVLLNAMPVTPNGKIDRLSLPDWNSLPEEQDTHYVEPRSPMEISLAEVWQNILHIKKIGVYDNFFELGGDSLSVIQAIGQMRNLFMIAIPMQEFFEKPTIADIVKYISTQHGGALISFQINRAARRDEYPLAKIQESFWFYHQLEPRNVFYNIVSNHIRGEFDISIFSRVLQEIINSNDSLRMVFPHREGQPYIVLADSMQALIDIIDLSNAGTERDALMMSMAREEIAKPFDLLNGPLIRTKIFRYGDNDHVVLLNMHHIISDGWSINVLLKKISTLYRTYTEHYNPGAYAAASETQYCDFIMWQNEQFNSEVMEQQMEYWVRQLSGPLPVLDLKEDKPRPEVVTYRGGVIKQHMDVAVTEQLRQLAHGQRSTLYMLLLAVYYVLLYKYTKQEEFVVGSPISGRTHPQIDDTIGCFVNTIALKNRISEELTFVELLSAVRANCLEAFVNADVPFDAVVAKLNPKRNVDRSPIFQAMMTMQEKPSNLLNLGDVLIEDAGVVNDLAPYDISVIIWVEETGTTLYTEYYADVFEENTISQMMRGYRNLIDAVLEDPSRKLVDLPLQTQEEMRRITLLFQDERDSFRLEHTLLEQLNAFGIDTPRALLVADNLGNPMPQGAVGSLWADNAGLLHHATTLEVPGATCLYNTGLEVYYTADRVIRSNSKTEDTSPDEQQDISQVEPELSGKTSELATQIHNIWAEVLQRDDISWTVNFFDVGGTSMTMVRVLSLLNKILPIQLSIVDLFKYPSITALARHLSHLDSKDSSYASRERMDRQRSALMRSQQMRKNMRNTKKGLGHNG